MRVPKAKSQNPVMNATNTITQTAAPNANAKGGSQPKKRVDPLRIGLPYKGFAITVFSSL